MAVETEKEAPPFDGERDGVEIEAGDVGAITGDGSGTALPPIEQDPSEPKESEEETSSIREYVILKVDKKIAQEVSRVNVSNKEAALKTLGEQTAEQGGQFRVVTARSWDPIFEVGIDRQTTIKITPQ